MLYLFLFYLFVINSMLICCCMLWKRKEYDVFPDYINNQTKVNPRFANYAKIKDNVVVVPVKDFIYEKGFLPDPNKKRKKKRNDGELCLFYFFYLLV
jgi:hypothetical protein